MKTIVAALSLLLLASSAFADGPAPRTGAASPSRDARRLPSESYHVGYTRRGCRIEQNWDGVQFTASVACAPGIRPD